MEFNSAQLFVELLHRLLKFEKQAKYCDAMLLHHLLQNGGDCKTHKTTSSEVVYALDGSIDRFDFQRSTARLKTLGYISAQTLTKSRTHFTVNREAVLGLLAKPLPRNMPGIDNRHFSFLDAWRAAQDATQTAGVTDPVALPEHPVAFT